jgi:peptidoglycan/LPS O-acetylase OafA/YrhL
LELEVNSKIKRLRELDFLRGIAIVLVLFRHQPISYYTTNMGWIGVDLFFVLSGFLVSGLLFREYLKFGDIKPSRFLIRRGFKIYPIYYLCAFIYLIPFVLRKDFNVGNVFADLVFIQNYTKGWGYLYNPSWSLAVEEHFYFGLSFLLWLILKKRWIKFDVEPDKKGLSQFEIFIFSVMGLCLAVRIITNSFISMNPVKEFTMTHLRIDSLLAGVLISYLFYFRFDFLLNTFRKIRYVLLALFIAGIIWTPFVDPIDSYFAKTIGFTMLFVAFSSLLSYFILTDNINGKLNLVFSKYIVNLVSRIGYASYSIYLIHFKTNSIIDNFLLSHHIYLNKYLLFGLTLVVSVSLGILVTHTIERYFLKIRDKYFPNRVLQKDVVPVVS